MIKTKLHLATSRGPSTASSQSQPGSLRSSPTKEDAAAIARRKSIDNNAAAQCAMDSSPRFKKNKGLGSSIMSFNRDCLASTIFESSHAGYAGFGRSSHKQQKMQPLRSSKSSGDLQNITIDKKINASLLLDGSLGRSGKSKPLRKLSAGEISGGGIVLFGLGKRIRQHKESKARKMAAAATAASASAAHDVFCPIVLVNGRAPAEESSRNGLPSPDTNANVSVCSSCPSSSENGHASLASDCRPVGVGTVGPRRTQSIAALDISEATSNDEDDDFAMDDLDDEDLAEGTHSEADERTNAPPGTGIGTGSGSRSASAEQIVQLWRAAQAAGRELINEVFSMDVDSLFDLLFMNSAFLADFHKNRKTVDLVQSEWESDPSGNRTRQLSFTMSLSNSMGPKQAQVTEVQTMRTDQCVSGEVYVIAADTNNAGIPYADSFSVAAHFAIVKVSPNTSKLTVISEIKYKKPVWGVVKGFIEKNTWAGLDDFFRHLAVCLHKECDGSRAGSPVAGPEAEAGLPVQRAGANPTTAVRKKTVYAPPTLTELAKCSPVCALPLRPLDLLHRVSALSPAQFVVTTILIVSFALMAANGILFYKLWWLETRVGSPSSSFPSFPSSSSPLRPLSTTPPSSWTTEEWLSLLHQREQSHIQQVEKWNRVIAAASDILKRTEQSLLTLQRSVHPVSAKDLRGILSLHPDSISADDKINAANAANTANAPNCDKDCNGSHKTDRITVSVGLETA